MNNCTKKSHLLEKHQQTFHGEFKDNFSSSFLKSLSWSMTSLMTIVAVDSSLTGSDPLTDNNPAADDDEHEGCNNFIKLALSNDC